MRVLDLFAGPGGWDYAATEMGLDPLGIEYDDAACATREAAGLRTLQGDVSALDPADFGPVDLLIASPPCQAWSMAGSRGGEQDKHLVYELTKRMARGESWGELGDDSHWEDTRSRLVCEPLRWIKALRPRWIALEQVPPVLDYWRHLAEILRVDGYGVWTGILEAERYGVPQTRERAILIAELDAPDPHPPTPTHQRYIPGEPQRHEMTLEGEILPWVSMSEALGWGMNARPYMSLTSGGGGTHTGGSNTREELRQVRDSEQWTPHADEIRVESTNGQHSDRLGSEPSSTIDSRTDQRQIKVGFPRQADDGAADENGYRARDFRNADEPAHSMSSSSARSLYVTELVPAGGDRPHSVNRDLSEPASTMKGDCHDRPRWKHERESNNGDVRVPVCDAAVLQGFPGEYPWQGSQTKQFQQIGNAVPPPLAAAVLNALSVADAGATEAYGETLEAPSEALRTPHIDPDTPVDEPDTHGLSWVGDFTTGGYDPAEPFKLMTRDEWLTGRAAPAREPAAEDQLDIWSV